LPPPYTVHLRDGIAPFDFKTKKFDPQTGTYEEIIVPYGPNDTFISDDVCETKRFIKTFKKAQDSEHREVAETIEGVRESVEQDAKEAGCIGEEYADDLFSSFSSSGVKPADESKPEEDSPELQGLYLERNAEISESGTGTGNTQQEGGSASDPGVEPTRPPEGEPHPTHGGESPQIETKSSDPIDNFSGCFYLQEKDLEIPNTIISLSFLRTYKSGDAAFGPFGWNWDHNFNQYIRILKDGSVALWRNLHEDLFKFNGTTFEPPRGIFEKLDRIAGIDDVFEITSGGGNIMHFERPSAWIDGERIPLIWIKDRHGNKLAFSYGVEDKLEKVHDDDNRFLKFEYDDCGLLIAVSDSADRKYEYYHDEQSLHLVSVTSPKTLDFPSGITKVYNYDDPFSSPKFRHNIISVEDSKGNVYLENKYEQDPSSWGFGRVVEQLSGAFLYQIRYTQIQWVPSNFLYINVPSLMVEVMNPDFGLETFTFNYRGDLLDHRYRLSKDKSYRVVIWQYEYDEQGNISVTTRPDGSQEICVYDSSNADPRMRGKLLQKEITSAIGFPSPSRIVLRAKYEAIYQLLREEENELGSKTRYKYDFDITPGNVTNSGKLLEVISPAATLPDGAIQNSITKYEYNNRGQNIATILPNGVRNEIVYGTVGSEQGRPFKRIFDKWGSNIESTIRYDAVGYVSEIVDYNGNSTKRTTNIFGLIEKFTLPAINGKEASHQFHYDSDKNLIAYERPRGNYVDPIISGDYIVDKFERDVLGFITRCYLSNNSSQQMALRICPDFRGSPVEIFNPNGSRIKKTYDERGLLLSEDVIGIDDKKLSTKRVYNRLGLMIQESTAVGETTKYEYDGFSRKVKTILPNKSEVICKWIKGDLLESEEVIGDDGFGNYRQLSKKSFTYDEKGRRITETIKSFTNDPSSSIDVTTTFFYDVSDNLEKIIDNRGGISYYQFDTLNRIKIKTDPIGNKENYTYDNNGNVIQIDSEIAEPNGTISIIRHRFAYDARNRKIETIKPDGAKLIEEYDDRDLIVRKMDYAGVATDFRYDSFGNCTQEVHDVGGLELGHQWIFDNMSRITAYVDPTGQISRYVLDSLGRICNIEFPNGYLISKKYNDLGQIVEETLGSGIKFEYIYDFANRLYLFKNKNCPPSINKIQTHIFKYDGRNRLVSAKVGVDEVIRNYDSMGKQVVEKSGGVEILCDHQVNSGIFEKVWPDGRTERYSHDLNNFLTKVEVIVKGSLGEGPGLIAAQKPSGRNNIGEVSYDGGLKIVNKYDERKRLVEIKLNNANIDNVIKYRYDTTDERLVEAILRQEPKISIYQFDNNYRLVNAKSGFTTIIPDVYTQEEHNQVINSVKIASSGASNIDKFDYDPADCRTRVTKKGNIITEYSYLQGHRIESDGVNNFSYYTEGTLKDDGQFTYEVDALGRINTIKEGATQICKIYYDALNRPNAIAEINKPVRTLHYFGQAIEQENENAIPVRQISVYPGSDIPIAYHSTQGTHYTLFDARCNLSALANTNGEIIELYDYNPFGVPEIKSPTGTILPVSNFGTDPIFGGERFLSSTQLYLSKRRLMNPVNGTFLSQDMKGYIDSPSLYVYTKQDPINNIDPLGEQASQAEMVAQNPDPDTHESHTTHLVNAGAKTVMEISGYFAELIVHTAEKEAWSASWGPAAIASRLLERQAEASEVAWLRNIRQEYGLPEDTAWRVWRPQIPEAEPVISKWGVGLGVVSGLFATLSGGLNAWRAIDEIENPVLKGVGFAGSLAQTWGGIQTIRGFATGNLSLISKGGTLGRFAGGPVTMLLSGHSFIQDIEEGKSTEAAIDALGFLAGAALTFVPEFAPVFAVTYLLSYIVTRIWGSDEESNPLGNKLK
jgi:RHS repeat-associated protein